MMDAARSMEFEKAARLRDQAKAVKEGKLAGMHEAGKVRRSDVEKVAEGGGRGGGRERKAGMAGVKVKRKRKHGG
jgi:excinuclease UvrABC nuclease subunit